MTLIEVLAGLVILGSLLVAMLMAKARHARQWQTANRTTQAVAAADRLLTAWWAQPADIRYPNEGEFSDAPGLTWRCFEQPNRLPAALEATVVRLEVLDRQTVEPRVLAHVDMLLPTPPAQETAP